MYSHIIYSHIPHMQGKVGLELVHFQIVRDLLVIICCLETANNYGVSIELV